MPRSSGCRLSRGGPRRARQHPAAAATSRTRPAPSAPSGPPSSPRSTTGRQLRARRRGDQGPHPAPTSTSTWSSSRQRCRPAGRPCTGPATPRRPARSSRAIAKGHGVDEVVKVKSMATQEIDLNEALAARGHRRLGDRPGRADRPARRRPAQPHPRAGDPPQPRRDPRDLPDPDGRGRAPRPGGPHRRAGGPRRGGPAAPAGEVPARQGRRLRRQLRGRRDRHARRRRVARATAGCA